ncbi:YHS domain-containing protein [Mycolicibacterium sp. BiH015]|uniref:YHS domain-containing protein n=1 Tax=Mycolicibacterium sp. BiH015 TaxID=3018808 RepID=UPI0022E1A098|nr:YHS domain-containing protein [Mycolicibacterium sp. BiH015]MDA2894341.1 YHS domain-containing protein [Mycolicibacterium sp. BiH015]
MFNDNRPTTSCCCGSTPHIEAAVLTPGARNLLDTEEQTTCPVMPGSPVNKAVAEAAGLFRDYRGRRYWFCCKGCGSRFDRDPDKYASLV